MQPPELNGCQLLKIIQFDLNCALNLNSTTNSFSLYFKDATSTVFKIVLFRS